MKAGVIWPGCIVHVAKWCLGSNIPDWMTHLEEAGPWQEVE